MSSFTLVETQPIEPEDPECVSENETYEDIQKGKTQPTVSKLDQKRANKTVECPKCHRNMNKKTYKYSHKCPNQDPPEPTPKVIENTKPSASNPLDETDSENEVDPMLMMMNQELIRKQQMLEHKQNNIKRLISRAF